MNTEYEEHNLTERDGLDPEKEKEYNDLEAQRLEENQLARVPVPTPDGVMYADIIYDQAKFEKGGVSVYINGSEFVCGEALTALSAARIDSLVKDEIIPQIMERAQQLAHTPFKIGDINFVKDAETGEMLIYDSKGRNLLNVPISTTEDLRDKMITLQQSSGIFASEKNALASAYIAAAVLEIPVKDVSRDSDSSIYNLVTGEYERLDGTRIYLSREQGAVQLQMQTPDHHTDLYEASGKNASTAARSIANECAKSGLYLDNDEIASLINRNLRNGDEPVEIPIPDGSNIESASMTLTVTDELITADVTVEYTTLEPVVFQTFHTGLMRSMNDPEDLRKCAELLSMQEGVEHSHEPEPKTPEVEVPAPESATHKSAHDDSRTPTFEEVNSEELEL